MLHQELKKRSTGTGRFTNLCPESPFLKLINSAASANGKGSMSDAFPPTPLFLSADVEAWCALERISPERRGPRPPFEDGKPVLTNAT